MEVMPLRMRSHNVCNQVHVPNLEGNGLPLHQVLTSNSPDPLYSGVRVSSALRDQRARAFWAETVHL